MDQGQPPRYDPAHAVHGPDALAVLPAGTTAPLYVSPAVVATAGPDWVVALLAQWRLRVPSGQLVADAGAHAGRALGLITAAPPGLTVVLSRACPAFSRLRALAAAREVPLRPTPPTLLPPLSESRPHELPPVSRHPHAPAG